MLAVVATAAVVTAQPRPEAARVVIVANANEPESVDLARHYAERRGIPTGNIAALSLPNGESIDWHQFVDQLHAPLQRWLLERDWIDAIAMDLVDEAGRRKMAVSGHRIEYLVTVRGVPLKIRQTAGMPERGGNGRASMATNQAAVDSELALIARNDSPLQGLVPNPLFRRSAPSAADSAAIVRVARIDGPTFAAARAMIDDAIEVEARGLAGRAVVDIGGPHRHGDGWLEEAAAALTEAWWAPQVQRDRRTLQATERADGVALYFGWYDGDLSGPFALPGYRFAPGAVVLHIHSFSAGSLRSSNGRGWSGPLVERGVAGTFGNVFEPYLEYTHHPHLVARALLRGATLGEAAYHALPAVSWQAIVIGDPLYRPLGVALDEQVAHLDRLPPRWASYVILREIAQREAAGAGTEELLDRLREGEAAYPSLALAVARARLLRLTDNPSAAAAALGVVEHLRDLPADQWALAAEACRMLGELGEARRAVAGWVNLFRMELPDAVRLSWLREARPLASEARDFRLGQEWDAELARLSPEEATTAP